ncbi:MAG TPA: asparagine synthase-related protein [Verrucomicrobiae bacterium]|nr:asparagine synthase-related protein [Verrucomicrobiae bacterium]
MRKTVEQAVGRQMVADVPVGAFLSGGLDSSAVVALARRHTTDRLQCFTVDEPQADPAALSALFICKLSRSGFGARAG